MQLPLLRLCPNRKQFYCFRVVRKYRLNVNSVCDLPQEITLLSLYYSIILLLVYSVMPSKLFPCTNSPDVFLIDTHCHLDMLSYPQETSKILSEAMKCGIGQVVTIGIDYASSCIAAKLAAGYNNVFATIGIHPHAAESATERELQKLASLAKDATLGKKVVAFGEIGLDYVKKYASKKAQQDAFERQLDLAKKLELPVIIHDRDAHEDTLRLLHSHGPFPRGGVMHCFSGDIAFAEKIIDLGFFLSIPGVVTFTKATVLQEVVCTIDLKNLLLETDSPFLAPSPFRGRPNQPAYMLYTAKKVAELKKISLQEVAQKTSANAAALFRLE